MRVNVYAEEITPRVEVIEKDGFTGVRFYLELPVTQHLSDPETGKPRGYTQHRGPFMHVPGDDDSSAVTFWSRSQMVDLFRKAADLLDDYHLAKAARLRRPDVEIPDHSRASDDGMPQP